MVLETLIYLQCSIEVKFTVLLCYRDLQDSGAHVGGGQPGAALCQCGLLPCQEDQEEADLCQGRGGEH